MNCSTCEKRKDCKTPCKEVKELLWKDNRVMERNYGNTVICYPRNGEIHFSELDDHIIDQFSTDDIIPWSSEKARMKQTAVFIERFFNKVPCKELAEKFGVRENTIVCMYRNAVKQLERIIDKLDARKEGLKATTQAERFTEDQKYFLLVSVFGFSNAEVARMFKVNRDRVGMKVKRMRDRFEALFSGEGKKEEMPIDDPPMPNKLSRANLVTMVEAYGEQGLSKLQAFKRIANRQAEIVGRPVKVRGIESRYYKAPVI